MRKLWTKGRSSTSWENSKHCIFTSSVKMFFRSPTPSRFDCNTLVSLGQVPLPISSSPQQESHNSGIYNILGSPKQSRLKLHCFINGLPTRPPFRGTPDICLASISYLLSSILNSKAKTMWLKFCCLLGLKHGLLIQLPAFCLLLPKLDCPETWSAEQAGLKLGDLPASVLAVLRLKVDPTTSSSKLFFNSLT